MHSINIDPVELIDFIEIVTLHSRRVFEDRGALVVSNGETHYFLTEDATGAVTIETNERDPNSPKSWEAELACASYALRYMLIILRSSLRGKDAPRLTLPFQLEDLPPGASVVSAPSPDGRPSDRDILSFDDGYVGTFGGVGTFRDAVLAAYLLPLSLADIAAFFRDGNHPKVQLPES